MVRQLVSLALAADRVRESAVAGSVPRCRGRRGRLDPPGSRFLSLVGESDPSKQVVRPPNPQRCGGQRRGRDRRVRRDARSGRCPRADIERAAAGEEPGRARGEVEAATDDPSAPLRPSNCTWMPSAGSRGTVVLAGDSVAAEFAEPVVQAGTYLHRAVTLATASGCPFIELRITGSFASETDCQRHVTQTLTAIERLHPDLVVIGTQASEYINAPGNGLAPFAFGEVDHNPAGKARLWQNGLGLLIRRLNRHAIPALVIQPLPVFRSPPSECAVILVLTNRCALTARRSTVETFRRLAVEAQDQAIEGSPRSATLDLIDRICNREICAQNQHGTLMYRNRDHLSVDGSLRLTTAIQAAMAHLLDDG